MRAGVFGQRAVLGVSTLFCALGPVGNGERDQGHHAMDPTTHRTLTAISGRLDAWQPTSGAPLEEIPVLKSRNGQLEADLNPAPRAIDLSGSQVGAIPYDENFTGPTLMVKPGDTLRVRLQNDSGQPTNIHYHGLHVSPKAKGDNVFRTMKSGSTYTSVIRIPKDHETGLFWYHAHMHGNTDPQIYGGMRGLLVVGDIVRKHLPKRFHGIRERLISINDAYEQDGTIQNAAPLPGDATLLLNGQLRPSWTMKPGETQLLRFANTGSDRFYRLNLPGFRFTVIAEDGSPVRRIWRSDALVMPPGKRFEVLVTAPRKPGTFQLKTTRYAQDDTKFGLNPAVALGTLVVEGERRNPIEPPRGLKGNLPDDLSQAPVERTRTFVFGLRSKGKNFARINGKFFTVGEKSVRPRLGTVERWILKNPRKPNQNNSQHPFHIHVNDFQVVAVNGKRYRARGQQDIVTVPMGGEVVIKQRFEQFTGKFVFHCHILGHEDGGMMQSVRVVR
jgi:suppressor of ftsI